ncbi:alpha/beta-hydrolase [Zopfia rhizophila CBS 207.26]|uniref:Alpha/beta-hydrolase n=1 Tax=Zopfia rhizophila CBS 207.26 TaxID=1314779 RepID=A0A6A6DQG5_9PEZI|nr:alpha/beta-hydrolase [Zopfia rhizophila CBS 207.26]
MATYQTAKTLYLPSPSYPNTTYAYLKLGHSSSANLPLLYLTHFRGTIDKVDPHLINILSRTRPTAADFLSLLGEKEVDILGFSMGGFVAQLLALNADSKVLKVRKLILGGTTASAGANIIPSPNSERVGQVAGAAEITAQTFQTLFFHENESGRKACQDWWKRVRERSNGYADGGAGIQAQAAVLSNWSNPEMSQGEDGSYERLRELDIPVLVANGSDDFIVPTVNSFHIQQRVPNAKLIVYPDSGHGFLYQYVRSSLGMSRDSWGKCIGEKKVTGEPI